MNCARLGDASCSFAHGRNSLRPYNIASDHLQQSLCPYTQRGRFFLNEACVRIALDKGGMVD